MSMPQTGSFFLVTGIELFFYLLTILFCIHAAVLAYHWFAYSDDRKTTWSALTVYFAGGALLLFIMASSIYFV